MLNICYNIPHEVISWKSKAIKYQSDFKNNAGLQCKVGQILETTKPIAPKQNGYDFAKRLEYTLRFGNALQEDVVICEVTSLGDVIEYEDEYNDYFELYVTSKLRIVEY